MIGLFDVHKLYREGKREVRALNGISLEIDSQQFVAIMGPSGSGKSTLLHVMAGLEWPSRGKVVVDGRVISEMPDGPLTLFRRRQIGVVFQFFNLLPNLSAIENVMLPWILDGRPRAEGSVRAVSLLEKMGLSHRLHHLPEELSGGENQRVAIARGLIFHPKILLADEPTGNLDSSTGAEILEILREVNQTEQCTVVMVTHNPQAAEYGQRVIYVRDGRLDPGP